MKQILYPVLLLTFFLYFSVRGSVYDQIGLTTLQAITTNLNGTGVRLAQPEAELSDNPPAFEINPVDVGQPVSLFTYISALATANTYPNDAGTNSNHAEGVGGRIYGFPSGMATHLAHVDSVEADYFYSNYVGNDSLPSIGDALVNQSFTFGNEPADVSVAVQQQLDSQYDNYAVQNNALFISAANNSSQVSPPGTAYNSIGVGAYGAGVNSGMGPTLDNGRCKPDINAPATDTSTATSLVTGTMALLMNAAARGDGGTSTAAAGDMRTLKALLLNGAVKPANWTNGPTAPLDARYGAGVANVFNAYEQLIGGKHSYSSSVKVSSGAAHPPGTFSKPVSVLSGWDLNTNVSTSLQDSINHYYFSVTNTTPRSVFAATATLVWNRAYNASYSVKPGSINNLNLYLYDAVGGSLVAASTSPVDNVEHLYVPRLPAGQYDLQVWKAGGLTVPSFSETYALAFDFVTTKLTATQSGGNVLLTWPVYPGGFGVTASTNLLSNQWSTTGLPSPTVSGGLNVLTIPAASPYQFFRLQRPNF